MTDTDTTTKPVTLKFDSLAFKLCRYFLDNPDEQLTRSDIAHKFSVPSSSVDACTFSARQSGLLAAHASADLGKVWGPGPNLKHCVVDGAKQVLTLDRVCKSASTAEQAPKAAAPSQGAHAPFGPAASFPQTTKHTRPPLPDPTTLKVEQGIPLPPLRANRGAQFQDVFCSMSVGDSTAVPRAVSKRLYDLAAKYGRPQGRKFALRHLDENTSRLWRTA